MIALQTRTPSFSVNNARFWLAAAKKQRRERIVASTEERPPGVVRGRGQQGELVGDNADRAAPPVAALMHRAE